MPRCLLLAVFLLSASIGLSAEAGFTDSISRADFEAAGLDRLTPAEREHLDRIVAAFKRGEIAAAEKVAAEAEVAKKAAEEQARVAKAEAEEARGGNKGFLAKAKVLLVPGTKIEYAEIQSTIKGSFEGWEGRTIFRLENGQRWQVFNSDEHYFTPPKQNVEVKIRPAVLGGYWMEVPALRVRVRVKLLSGN